jgi:2',3'-cyclic-nucleotide 2'-phosphodiesterase (5'-nucleotidase family)
MNITYPTAAIAPVSGQKPVGGEMAVDRRQKKLTFGLLNDTFARAGSPMPYPLTQGKYIPPVPPNFNIPGLTPLRVIYNNDPHEKFKALPHLVSAFRLLSLQGQQAGRDVLRLNSGDNNVGKESEDWNLQVRMLNMMNYHAVTLGNHELDLGSANYAKELQAATFPTLLSNLNIPANSSMARLIQSGKMLTLPQVIRDQHGTYGLIGITTPELKTVVSKQAKLEGEVPQNFNDTATNVKAQVEWLQSQGINKVIVLSHMGYDLEQKLAQTVPGIDIIVGGHSHNVVNGITPGANYLASPNGEPVLVVQGGKNAQYMGVADVLFDPQGRLIPQQNQLFSPYAVPADPQALALQNSVLGTPQKIAEMATPYDANGNEFHVDPVAQFSADTLRTVSGSDIAFVRSSEIRNNFDPGTFTDQDLKALMPFTDPMIRLKLTGQEILNSLNRSAQGVKKHESHPGMLHPSGMSVTINQQTGQVQQAYVFNKAAARWEALDPQKQYTVAMGEFSVQNHEFPDFSHPERIEWNSRQPLRAFFNWGLQQAGAPNRPVNFRDDGRLQIV